MGTMDFSEPEPKLSPTPPQIIVSHLIQARTWNGRPLFESEKELNKSGVFAFLRTLGREKSSALTHTEWQEEEAAATNNRENYPLE